MSREKSTLYEHKYSNREAVSVWTLYPSKHIRSEVECGKNGPLVYRNRVFQIDQEGLHNISVVPCQLDTGATCNVMALDDLSTIIQVGDPPINSSVKCKLCGAKIMKPIGECILGVKFKGTRQTLKVKVVQHFGSVNPYCGLRLAKSCNLLRSTQTSQLACTKWWKCPSEKDLLSKYQDIFSGLRHIGNWRSCLTSVPHWIQHSPHRVALALWKDAKKIIELEDKGIVMKV